MIIETKRLRIRPAVPDDSAHIAELWNHPEVMKHVGYPHGLGITAERIERQLKQADDRLVGTILIVEPADSTLCIGQAMMHSPDTSGLSTTDIKIHPSFQGSGYGKEIKQALLDHLFNETPCRMVESTPNLLNTPSIRLQESCGGIRIGRGRWLPGSDSAACIPVDYWIYRIYKDTPPYADIRCRKYPYAAIVPAAGRSSRMKRFKPLLPWPPNDSDPNNTVIRSTIRSLMAAGLDPILVAVGNHAHAIRTHLAGWPVQCIDGAKDSPSMSDSILTVLPLVSNSSCLVILPADHPDVSSETVRILISRHESEPDRIHLAAFRDRTGHPILFPPAALPIIRSGNLAEGLRSVMRDPRFSIVRHDLNDPGILTNLDTPADYRSIPSDPVLP